MPDHSEPFDKRYLKESPTSYSPEPPPEGPREAPLPPEPPVPSSTEAGGVPVSASYGTGKPIRRIIKAQVIHAESEDDS